MTVKAMQLELRQSYAFVARNFNLVKRYWGWELVWLAYSIANALSVTFIGKGANAITGQDSIDTQFLTIYLMIGTLVWHFLSNIFSNISEMIAWERWEGTIEYTFMAPIRRMNQMLGQTVFAVIHGFLFTAVIGVSVALFFDLTFEGADFLSAVIILLAGSISFVGIGVVASILPLLYPERGAQMTHIVQALFLLVSGVYYPTSVLPDWLQFLSQFSPATYVLEGMRAALLPETTNKDPLSYVWPLLLMGLVMLPLGVHLFQRAERYTKRTGKLKRNG
ncbi:MAG: ABC transporter permease [Anaerolineae bacterium]|nr:ABC transporter permease [Anaerolineae bacterium]